VEERKTGGRRAEVAGGRGRADDERRSSVGARSGGRRVRASGALTRGDGEREMREGTSGSGGGCMRMHCGRPSRGERDKLIRCLGLGLWAVYCFMGLSLP